MLTEFLYGDEQTPTWMLLVAVPEQQRSWRISHQQWNVLAQNIPWYTHYILGHSKVRKLGSASVYSDAELKIFDECRSSNLSLNIQFSPQAKYSHLIPKGNNWDTQDNNSMASNLMFRKSEGCLIISSSDLDGSPLDLETHELSFLPPHI